MSRFFDLFRYHTPPPRGRSTPTTGPCCSRMGGEVATTEVLGPGDPVPGVGRFLLIGVATWSGYDMKLLDALRADAGGPDVIGVFDTAECQSDDDFEPRVPGIGTGVPDARRWAVGGRYARRTGIRPRGTVDRFPGNDLDPGRMSEILTLHPIRA